MTDQPRYSFGPPRAYRPIPCRCALQWEGWFAVEEVPLDEAGVERRQTAQLDDPEPEAETTA